MNHFQILKSPVERSINNYNIAGEPRINNIPKIKDLSGIFQDEKSNKEMYQMQVVYTIQSWLPVADGTNRDLFFGTLTIYSGIVGKEYFITQEHFHS
jgi:glucose-6-phosphate isomerase